MREILSRGKQFGEGSEGMVFEADHNSNWVIKEFSQDKIQEYTSPEFMEAAHYFTKILHGLFPNAIPAHHGYVKELPYKEVRQKISLVQEPDLSALNRGLNDINEKIDTIGVELDGLKLDNFGLDLEGNCWYLDTCAPWYKARGGGELRLMFDERKLRQALESLRDIKEKELLLKYLDQVLSLYQKVQKKK